MMSLPFLSLPLKGRVGDEVAGVGSLHKAAPPGRASRVHPPRCAGRDKDHLIACGLIGLPVPPVMISGGPQKKNSYTLSLAQSCASSLRWKISPMHRPMA